MSDPSSLVSPVQSVYAALALPLLAVRLSECTQFVLLLFLTPPFDSCFVWSQCVPVFYNFFPFF